MPTWFAARQLERSDRYVQRCRVRGGGHTSRARVSFCIEEALRLISLPGEHEGCVYYFREVSVANVSARASRQEWINAFQGVLHDLATHAIHGSDPRAATANAVVFRNYQEALEILLARILRREPIDHWYWPQVSGAATEASRAEKVLAVTERLKELPGSWLGTADSVIAAVGRGDPVTLLTMLPLPTANQWLQELAPRYIASTRPRPVHLHQTAADMLLRAVATLGSADPRVLWLASLAVVQAAPSELSAGTVVNRARATLQRVAEERGASVRGPVVQGLTRTPTARSDFTESATDGFSQAETLRYDERQHPTGLRFVDKEGEPAAIGPSAASPPDSGGARRPLAELPLHITSKGLVTGEARAVPADHERIERGSPADAPTDSTTAETTETCSPVVFADRLSLGEPTRAAGLYFLLNALRRLGIAEALTAHPATAEQGLVAHIMKHLALHAEVEAGDPVWRWINSSLSQVVPADAPVPAGPELFPSNLRATSRDSFDAEYFSRVWCVAVRRWCWRRGGITVREVVSRGGLDSLNRTDLDVTLPLSSADLRIRRVGLDLDPGWLPWFGKVVRFHYVWDEAANVH
jgi:hypothetical protein